MNYHHHIAPESLPQIIGLNGLTTLLKGMAPEISIGDMKDAANMLTLPFEKVNDYVHGDGYDMVTTTDLIAFFQRKISARHE